MGASTNPCPHCGTPVPIDNHFCPECGKAIIANKSPKSGTTERKKPSFKGTMLAYESPIEQMPKGVAPQAGEPQPAATPAEDSSSATSEPKPAVESGAAEEGKTATAPAAAETPKKRAERNKTIIGLPSQQFFPGAAPAEQPPAQPSQGQPPASEEPEVSVEPIAAKEARPEGDAKPRAKTILGMPSALGPLLANRAAPAEGQKVEPTVALADGAVLPSGGRTESANKTILGMPLAPVVRRAQDAGGASSDAAAQPHASAGAGPAPETGRTILGVGLFDDEPAATALQPAATPPSVAEQAGGDTGEEGYGDETEEEVPRSAIGGKPLLWAAITLLFLAIVAGAVLFVLNRQSSNVRASVVTIESGEGLLFEVPGALPGSKIRFGGQEKPLEAGRANFLLAADSVRAGENVVMFDVVSPDGKTEPATITLSVDFRIRVDTSPLQTAEPAVDVLVNALPGTSVTLDGKPLSLDKEGRGVQRYPIDPAAANADGIVEHVVRYRIQPASGEAKVDELHTKIPIASMQIDRPGLEAVTDKDSIEIAGAVSPSAQVTIDGQSVPVQAGRFLYRYSLANTGSFNPKVVAREGGKAPRVITLSIRRVADLKEEAEKFRADANLTYARIAQNPAIYAGQKVAIEGRVFNVNVESGQSVLQLLVRECPSGTRCSVWVTYPFATDAVVDSWVRVLGSVEGQQQFRSENNRVVTVPKIAATYVIPLSQK